VTAGVAVAALAAVVPHRIAGVRGLVDLIGMDDVMPGPGNATTGWPQPAASLIPLVYDELRRLAAAKLALEPDWHTLDATGLVHEAYLRLGAEQSFTTKSGFMRAAAVAMRRVLVDHARAKRADKRGGNRRRIDLADQAEAIDDPEVLALDEALTELATVDPEAAEFVELRYFTGMTIAQAADALGISPRTADRTWAYARAWLFRRISGAELA
jgi:RNA polymerase sigma factor (TIGR02999 family)